MSWLWQPQSTILNCNKLTISMWARSPAPAPSGYNSISLFEFGGLPFFTSGIVTWVYLYSTDYNNPSTLGALGFGSAYSDPNDPLIQPPLYTFCPIGQRIAFCPLYPPGQQYVHQGDPVYQLQIGSGGSQWAPLETSSIWVGSKSWVERDKLTVGAYIVGPLVSRPDLGSDPVPSVYAKMDLPGAGGKWEFGKWHHIFFALDASNGNGMLGADNPPSFGDTKYSKAYLYVNGELIAGGSSVGCLEYVLSSMTSVPEGPGSKTAVVVETMPITMPNNPTANATFSNTISPWYDNPTPVAREYGDVMAWFGTFIDPTIAGVLDPNFFVIRDGKGYPADWHVAPQSFGIPSVQFHGKASDNSFFVDHGSAGTFSRLNSFEDFTPTPSYG